MFENSCGICCGSEQSSFYNALMSLLFLFSETFSPCSTNKVTEYKQCCSIHLSIEYDSLLLIFTPIGNHQTTDLPIHIKRGGMCMSECNLLSFTLKGPEGIRMCLMLLNNIEVPDMIHNIILPHHFFQTHCEFGTKSVVIFF